MNLTVTTSTNPIFPDLWVVRDGDGRQVYGPADVFSCCQAKTRIEAGR